MKLPVKLPEISDAALRKAPEWMLIAGVVAFLAVAVWMLWPHPHRLPPAEQYTRDSLAITKPRADSARHATSAAVAHVIAKIVHDSAAIRAALYRAAAAGRRADSTAAVAQALADTNSRWHAAYEQRTTQVADLQAAVDTLVPDLTAARDTLVRVRGQQHDDSVRFVRGDEFNARLATDVQRGDCRVLWIKCPSRKQAFVAGVLAIPAARIAFNAVIGKPPLAGLVK